MPTARSLAKSLGGVYGVPFFGVAKKGDQAFFLAQIVFTN
jgi:hypothetical protein